MLPLDGLLAAAGWQAIQITGETHRLHIADTLDEAVRSQSEIGPMSRALAELEGDAQTQAIEAARTALATHMGADGLHLDGAVWIVSAT